MGKSITRSIWSMIIINITILIATVSIHELGHAFVGKLIGCVNAKAVIYDSSSSNPYTELLCDKNISTTYLAGLIFTTLFGLSFMFFDKNSQKALTLIIIGFGILLAALDMVEITGINLMKYVFIFFGLLSLVIGQVIYGILTLKENVS
ncbi:MAG: M50 family metallopeptidase [Candidatus Aenigmatarchaeota archaeon]